MPFSLATNRSRTPLRRNRWMQAEIVVFVLVWIATLIGTPDLSNWCLENSLVALFIGGLLLTYRRYEFSDLSYLLITVFLCLHVYGAMYSYAENPLGRQLQELLHARRNFYDRIVHFSFGFFLAYPMRELFIRKLNFPPKSAWATPVVLTLFISGLYELIEWAVAGVFFPSQGTAYLGTQGDEWDAQKDMFAALCGAVIASTMTSLLERRSAKRES